MESDLQPLACGRVAVASEMFQSKGSDGAEMYKIFIPKSLETDASDCIPHGESWAIPASPTQAEDVGPSVHQGEGIWHRK